MNIRLEYYKSQYLNYQWMILYEFSVDSNDLWNLPENKILDLIINTRILSKTLKHQEIDLSQIEIDINIFQRPYDFKNINALDFTHFNDKDGYEKILRDFANEDTWGKDQEDFRSLLIKSDYTIRERTSFANGFWFLNKDKFLSDKKKLDKSNWIYLYWLTIIEIDKNDKLIRTIDFGYD